MEPLAQAAEDMATMKATLARLETEVSELKEIVRRYETPPLMSTREFCRRYGWTMGELQSKLATRGVNGLEAAVVQETANGRILIDPTKFFEILKRPRRRRRR